MEPFSMNREETRISRNGLAGASHIQPRVHANREDTSNSVKCRRLMDIYSGESGSKEIALHPFFMTLVDSQLVHLWWVKEVSCRSGPLWCLMVH